MIDKNIDVGILATIPSEAKTFLSVLGIETKFHFTDRNSANYLKAEIYSDVSKSPISVVVKFLARESGNVETGICTSRFLNDWYPRLMCLVGTSVGIPGATHIGDVIIPSKIYDRTIKTYKDSSYLPRSYSYSRSSYLGDLLRINPFDKKSFSNICEHELSNEVARVSKEVERLGLSSNTFSNRPKIIEGTLLSDNILIRNPQYFRGAITELDDKCVGADMEASGFVRACLVDQTDFPWFVIHGISSLGSDNERNDEFEMLASKSACIALRELLTTCLDLNQLQENPHAKEIEQTFEFNIVEQIRDAYREERWDDVCRIAPLISRFLWITGQYDLRIEIGNMVVEAASMVDNDSLRATYLIDDTGWTLFEKGNAALARTRIRDGLRIAKDVGNHYMCSKAHRHLASLLRRANRYADAEKELNLALNEAKLIEEISKRDEMNASLTFSLAKLHGISPIQSSRDHCVEEAQSAANAFIAIGDKERAAKVYAFLGDMYIQNGNQLKAITTYQEGLDLSYSLGRYDEIKRNTNALLKLSGISDKEKSAYIHRVITFCNNQKLYVELNFWNELLGGLL